MKKLAVAAVGLALAGCASTRPGGDPCLRSAGFLVSEYEPFQAPGDGAIKGQAFLVTRSGNVKTAAGRGITLRPVTSLSTEFIEKNVLGGCKAGSGADSAMFRCDHREVADADGRFEFTGLAPGRYYIACEITWDVSEYTSAYTPIFGGLFFGVTTHTKTGGLLLQTVQVDSGAVERVILNQLAKDETNYPHGPALR